MEYKIYKILRKDLKIPYLIRLFFAIFFIFISLFPIILPLFPGSIFLGIFFLVVWVIFLISAEDLKKFIKIRKSILFMFLNITKKNILKQKTKDIKRDIKHILKRKTRKKIKKYLKSFDKK